MGRTPQLQERSIFNVPLGEAAEGLTFQSCYEGESVSFSLQLRHRVRSEDPRALQTPECWQADGVTRPDWLDRTSGLPQSSWG